VIVVDASVVATALADDGVDGDRMRTRLAGQDLFAPELVDLEVVSVWRRAARVGGLEPRRAEQALTDLGELELVRAPHGPLVSRIWELRENLTPYDAAYVALAEALESPLVTADRRLSKAPGVECQIELVA
jgi:predicted nucleic acid-binding protein